MYCAGIEKTSEIVFYYRYKYCSTSNCGLLPLSVIYQCWTVGLSAIHNVLDCGQHTDPSRSVVAFYTTSQSSNPPCVPFSVPFSVHTGFTPHLE